MTSQRFTEKSQEALIAAQRLAQDSHHPEVDALHLLAALAEQEGGVVPLVVRGAGADRAPGCGETVRVRSGVLQRRLRPEVPRTVAPPPTAPMRRN